MEQLTFRQQAHALVAMLPSMDLEIFQRVDFFIEQQLPRNSIVVASN